MSRRPARRRSGILMPAVLALVCAALLFISHRFGGDAQVDALLDAIAANRTFIASSIALETGLPAPEISAAVRAASEQPIRPEQTPPAIEAESAPPPAAKGDQPPLPAAQDKRDLDIRIQNDANLPVDTQAMLAHPLALHATHTGAQVLIYHTHSTEAYTPDAQDVYTPSDSYRTRNEQQNVIRVGAELKQVLEARGISVIHLTEIFDDPAYSGSYGRSLAAAQRVLKRNPEIQVTIDLHRDAILTKDGAQYRTASTIDGQETAQLMLVIGTNASGLEHPNWQDNMNFAVNLQADANGAYPGLMRPVNLRAQRFNTHLRSGSILLECGSSGNTLSEALTAIRLFGNVLANRLLA